MTDANRILDAAAKAMRPEWTQDIPENSFFRLSPEDEVSPVVVAVLRELAKSYEDPYKVCQEDLIGDELADLADEIEGEKRWG